MRIHREGIKIIPIAFFFLAVLDALVYFFLKEYLIFYFLMVASLVLAALIVFFFRVPNRKIELNETHVLAPADGDIVAIEPLYEKDYFKDERIQVSIFMSPLNVHQNRAPVSGEVVYVHHKNGRFYPAFIAKSSEENERCSTVFKMKDGTQILSRQIAGAVARRIANYKKPGDFVVQGQEYGFIRFGSRVDVFLPADAKINVSLHQKSIGGKTILATL
ncbi:phosphatidylserine decarboxylase family protein [Maribellus maritimus]|uniref:phosphatidylserine decarboxylase family protein n=1 Tax=Maribellus maritimus TaxID=2870838 RepID=UPI001EEB838F|nr:phosphatidylserine decarboxylase family protein [Maribellus maritimus]MCG6186617.1 phosphatidylserine decarboxylase family protein [Maribellus maritimus]